MWEKNIKPFYTAQIRVNRGFYYHHGIYLSDDAVVHFAAKESDSILDPTKARIILTTLEEFLRGGVIEVREYSEDEQKKVRDPSDIANYALSCLGNGGYDLLQNNCEHFSNECVFGVKSSEQVTMSKKILEALSQR